MIAIESFGGVAFQPTLLQAIDLRMTKIPASRTLQQIARNRREIPDLRRGRSARGLCYRGVPFANLCRISDLMQCDQSADTQSCRAIRLDAVHPIQPLQIDQCTRLDELLLEQIDGVDTASQGNIAPLREQP